MTETAKLIDENWAEGLNSIPPKPKFSLAEFRLELLRIEWPKRSIAIRSAGAVFLIMAFFIVYIAVLDMGLVQMFQVLKR